MVSEFEASFSTPNVKSLASVLPWCLVRDGHLYIWRVTGIRLDSDRIEAVGGVLTTTILCVFRCESVFYVVTSSGRSSSRNGRTGTSSALPRSTIYTRQTVATTTSGWVSA